VQSKQRIAKAVKSASGVTAADKEPDVIIGADLSGNGGLTLTMQHTEELNLFLAGWLDLLVDCEVG
jgi:hypothetical protein